MTNDTLTSRWFIKLRARDEARLRLVCFSSAGAGASSFGRWPEHLPADVETWAVQLPGRETRRLESPLDDLGAIVDGISRHIRPLLDRPFAFFGHSMGAVVAFETARRLEAETPALSPESLFLSGRGAPNAGSEPERLDSLPDDEFISAMDRRYGGVPALLKEDMEFRELYLPPLRADVTALSNYRHSHGQPLECPIHVLGGLGDRTVPRESMDAWVRHTVGRFGVHTFPGDHFFVNTARVAVLSLIAAELAGTSWSVRQ